MTLKMKLISSIMAFCLILGMLIVGVFALREASLSVGGSIMFNADGIEALIQKISVTPGALLSNQDEVMKTLKIDTTKTEPELKASPEYLSWSNIELQFVEGSGEVPDPVELKFSITNQRDDKQIKVDLKVKPVVNPGTDVNADNLTIEVYQSDDNSIGSLVNSSVMIGEEKTKNFTIKFSLKNDVDTSVKFDVEFNLTSCDPPAYLRRDFLELVHYGDDVNGFDIVALSFLNSADGLEGYTKSDIDLKDDSVDSASISLYYNIDGDFVAVALVSKGTIYAPKDCSCLFESFEFVHFANEFVLHLNFDNFDTSLVENMDNMFDRPEEVRITGTLFDQTPLDLSGFNMTNVRSAEDMFGNGDVKKIGSTNGIICPIEWGDNDLQIKLPTRVEGREVIWFDPETRETYEYISKDCAGKTLIVRDK